MLDLQNVYNTVAYCSRITLPQLMRVEKGMLCSQQEVGRWRCQDQRILNV